MLAYANAPAARAMCVGVVLAVVLTYAHRANVGAAEVKPDVSQTPLPHS